MAVNLNADVAITANTGGATGATLGGVIADGTGGSKLILDAASTGTVTLTAANTYTGGTFVNGGIAGTGATGDFGTGDVTVGTGAGLVLGNNTSIADTATLTFGNSTIELNYTGTETVGALYDSITGTYLASGTYTADALNALANADVFSGEGSLFVSAIPEPATAGAMLGAGVLVLAALRRRRRRA
jgi:autotransporter-associated beta strand protein